MHNNDKKSAPSPLHIQQVCAWCKEQGTCFQKCGRCRDKSMRYCSRECQKKDWPRHKLLCETIREGIRNFCVVMLAREACLEFVQKEKKLIDTILTSVEEDDFVGMTVVVLWLACKKDVQKLNNAMHKYGLCIALGQPTELCSGVRYKHKHCHNETALYVVEQSTKRSTRYASKNKMKRTMKM